jgi:hypothetical protein
MLRACAAAAVVVGVVADTRFDSVGDGYCKGEILSA